MSIELRNKVEDLERRVKALEHTCALLTDRCRELGVDVAEVLNVANARQTLTLPKKQANG